MIDGGLLFSYPGSKWRLRHASNVTTPIIGSTSTCSAVRAR